MPFATAVVVVLLSPIAADPYYRPVLHDWHIRDYFEPGLDVLPTPHVGWDWPTDSEVYFDLYDELIAADLPVGITLREGTAPLTGWQDPEALATTMLIAPK